MADPGHLNQRVTHLAGPELRALRLSTSASLSNSLLHVPSLPLQSWVPGLLYHLGQVPCLKRQHLALLLLPTPLSNPVLPITALPRVSLFLSLYSCQSVFDSVSRLLIPDLLFHSLRPDFHVSFLLCDCALRHSTSFSTYAVFHSWHSCLLCAIMSHLSSTHAWHYSLCNYASGHTVVCRSVILSFPWISAHSSKCSSCNLTPQWWLSALWISLKIC